MTDRERLILIFTADDEWSRDPDDLWPLAVLEAIDRARKGFRMPCSQIKPFSEGTQNETFTASQSGLFDDSACP
jgi:hypothetical protein